MSKPNLRDTLEVQVDVGEPDARKVNYVETLELVQRYFKSAYKARLKIGDIAFKNLMFELKSWEDFINALTKDNGKRFRNQLYNMWNNPELDCYYFIYGDWGKIWEYSEFNLNAILGALGSIMGRYQIKCCIFRNKAEAVYTACKIIEKTQDHKEIRPQTYVMTTDNLAINMIMSGAERFQEKAAIGVLEMLGSVKNVVNSDAKTLMKAKGLGKKTAQRFIETVNFDFSEKKEFEKDFNEHFIEQDILLKEDNKDIKCKCGCNVFRKSEKHPNKYKCNSCGTIILGEEDDNDFEFDPKNDKVEE